MAPAAAIISFSPSSAEAAGNKDALVADLQASRKKLEPIPDLLQKSDWESVRNILKTPPVNQLWNLGDSQNTLVKLAKETGEFNFLEVKDELSISLQMCVQYTYDNVFFYYQPGNGKFKVKEPTEMAKKAMTQIEDAIKLADASWTASFQFSMRRIRNNKASGGRQIRTQFQAISLNLALWQRSSLRTA